MPSRIRQRPTGRTGRMSKISETVIESITEAIENGVPQVHAARAAGITDTTLRDWETRGWEAQRLREEGKEPDTSELIYERFSHMLVKSRSQKMVKLTQGIIDAGYGGHVTREKTTVDKHGNEHTEKVFADKKWQALAWILERTESDTYSLKHQVEHSGTVKQVNLNLVANIPDSQAMELSKVLALGSKTVE